MPEPKSIKMCQFCKDGKTYSWSKLIEHIVQKHRIELNLRKFFGLAHKCPGCSNRVSIDYDMCPHCYKDLKKWREGVVAASIAIHWPIV